jgi:hypothetical protein
MPVRRPLQLPLALAAVLAAALLALGAGSAAAKATITLDPGCYQSGAGGLLTGTGFTPNGTWTAKLAGTHQIGTGHTDAKGRIRATFTAPVYHGTTGTRELTLSVTDGPHVASTTFQMTPLTASFSPRTGDPATLRVRWRVLGLGPQHGVYVHYIRPDGALQRTVRIGTTRGPCGTLKTGPIALFPFKYAYGRWTFQVDASSHFSKATLPRLLIAFDIKKPKRQQAKRSRAAPRG